MMIIIIYTWVHVSFYLFFWTQAIVDSRGDDEADHWHQPARRRDEDHLLEGDPLSQLWANVGLTRPGRLVCCAASNAEVKQVLHRLRPGQWSKTSRSTCCQDKKLDCLERLVTCFFQLITVMKKIDWTAWCLHLLIFWEHINIIIIITKAKYYYALLSSPGVQNKMILWDCIYWYFIGSIHLYFEWLYLSDATFCLSSCLIVVGKQEAKRDWLLLRLFLSSNTFCCNKTKYFLQFSCKFSSLSKQ